MRDPASLATRYAGRPVLMTSTAARSYAERLRALDPRAFERPSRMDAILRKLSFVGQGRRAPLAMEDAEAAGDPIPEVPLEERLAYSPRWAGEPDDLGFCWSLNRGVALICCDTPLVERGDIWCGDVFHGYDTLTIAFREALADERVKGVFLRLDSPGGVVGGGLPALAALIRDNREAAGGKPIWVYADMACSAAYWIAAQADRILAPGVGLVGSIGAVIVHENWSAALAKEGVEITSIEFPADGLKTDGAWWKSLSETALTALTSDVAQVGRDFIADVSAGRPHLTGEALLATQADAYMARHDDPARSGEALGFVDGIATEEQAFEQLLAHIAAPAEGTAEDSQPPAAPVSGSAPAASKETPMRSTTTAPRQSKAERIAAIDASAEDKLDRIQQILDEPDEEEKPEEEPPADPPADDTTAQSGAQADAQRIAGSAEAKAHPHLANAAIATGQTFAQFKATIAAHASAPKAVRQLGAAMAGSKRLGPDATAGSSGDAQPSALARRAEARRTAAA
ncbi:S49 family peptidase [Brevundimonas sp.]|uniref:S49 family peptidase n=1 Tax=Brevundimonas sp. TaxID=1871086 RepID=UPI002D2BFDD1|nr:S49 family peptidase [Brevundimonas sp.]HYD26977.1 S49 family peptidase [Brevundimonas sp.]